jgi:hypothetical protein
MKFPAQEIVLGALLMIAAFAMGMMWSSVGAPPAHEILHKPGELLTGIATVALVIVTYLLFKATKVLARSAAEDSRNRRIQATADAWIKLRADLELPNLTKETSDAIDAAGKTVRPQLRKLEGFAQVVNSGVYDLETFNQISGNWFVQQVRWIKPYIDLQQKRNPDAYREIVDLGKRIENIHQAQ